MTKHGSAHKILLTVIVSAEFECDIARAIETALEGATIATQVVGDNEYHTVVVDVVAALEVKS